MVIIKTYGVICHEIKDGGFYKKRFINFIRENLIQYFQNNINDEQLIISP